MSCPVLRLWEVRPEKAVLSSRPDAFRAASGKQVDPQLHSSTFHHSLTLSISQVLESISVKIMETYHDPYQSFSMDSEPGSHWSDFDSRYHGLTMYSAPALLPSSFDARHNAHSIPVRHLPPTHYPPVSYSLPALHLPVYHSLPAHRLPVEIFSEIFLYTVQADSSCRANLMLVCRDWHNIMLSTPGIHSQLRIYWWTKKRDVERFGRRWFLDMTVDVRDYDSKIDDWNYKHIAIDPVEFHACFMAAAEAASRWRSLALLSLPPPGEYEDLQTIHPLQHLESLKLATSCNFGNFLEPLLNAITTTVTPRFTVMEVFHPDAALSLLKPSHLQIFSSLTTLRLICKRMQNPVDVLPSLHKLEIFEAHHLFLPMYPPSIELPLVQTLWVLHLKSVSVQWMAGQVFLALEECSIIFPHHAYTIQSVYMPSCSILKYDSNNLGTLDNFHTHPLGRLEIKCGQCRTWRGSLQLFGLHPIFATQSLTCLHLEIKCSEQLLASMLRLVPSLEELWMGLSSPHSLSSAFFLAFTAGRRNDNLGPSNHMVAPLGRKLRMLHLHYKRWLRGPERNALIQTFGAVVASCLSKEQDFSFRFGFGEGSELQEWIIHEPVEMFGFGGYKTTVIGTSSPDGIVPLSRSKVSYCDVLTESEYLPLPRESEYIATDVSLNLPIDFLFSFHSLKELKMNRLHLRTKPDTHPPLNAPSFHKLRVLVVGWWSLSFFAGQTFHKLERFKEWAIEEGLYREPIPEQGPLIGMPVCTRLAVSLSTLATLKLPQIHELCVNDIGEENHIWEKHIAVNANLSGLKLLHVLYLLEQPPITFTKVLGLLPALESLIVGVNYHHSSFVNCLEAFIPVHVPGPSGPNQSSWEGQISGLLCPRLESLQIEGISLPWEAELLPTLKDIVTQRAAIGCPLKSFTFYKRRERWQLIGRDKGFMMEKVVPAKEFQLDI